MQTAIIVIVVLLLLSNNRKTAGVSTGAQNGPGVNSNNLVNSLLNMLTRGQQSGQRSGGSSGGAGTSGGGFHDPNAGKQSRGNLGDSTDAGFLDSGDGLSGFLNAFPPGTTLGDAITEAGYSDFRTGLSEVSGVDVAPVDTTTTDIASMVLNDGGIQFDSPNVDAGVSSGDPWSVATGQGVSGVQDSGEDMTAAPYNGGDDTTDGGDVSSDTSLDAGF